MTPFASPRQGAPLHS
ncbi:extensin-like [Iris pallida]|uniref:Extensin-like n=1 Tax=Iris pallida TaxID=29817 RepID=A0AAX6DJ98_IRIPA|nr:extensin-like [Iris pallida]